MVRRFWAGWWAVLFLAGSAAAQSDPDIELYLRRPATDVREKQVSSQLEAAIQRREKEAAAAREEAIHLIEAYLAEHPNTAETPEALFKLAELYWEDAKVAFLGQMGRYQAAKEACHKDRATCGAVPRRPPSLNLTRSQSIYQRLVKNYPHFRKIDTVLYLYAFSLRDQGRLADSVQYFQRILDEFPRSRFVADAWMAIAEHRFYDDQNYRTALEGYEKVVGYPDSQLYDLALFKTAWCYWKLGDTNQAAKRFKDVLDLGKTRANRSGEERRRAAELRNEALEYLVELFTEDESKTAEDAYEFLAQIGGKEYSRDVMKKLAETFYDQTRYDRAVPAYRFLISLDKNGGDAPDYQRKVVEAYQLGGDVKKAVAEMRRLAEDYGPQSEWAKANADRPNTVAHARQLAEESIRQLAKTLHADAQKNEKESHVIDSNRYARAAEAYEFYLSKFADAKDATELRYLRADILYFKLKRYEDAGNEYLAVGKSAPVGKLHKEALLQAMSAFEKLRQPIKTGGGAQAAGGGVKREITESDRKFAEAADIYATLFPNDRDIVTVIYKNGQFFYDYGDYDEAVKRFGLIVERYPTDPNAGPAGDQILDALNKAKDYENIETWGRRLKKTKPFQSKTEQDRLDRLIVDAVMKSGEKYAAAGRYEQAAGFFLRVPKEYPGHPRAAKALNNAGAALEKAKRPEDAVRAYKELVDKYPNAPETPEAAFIMARVYESIAYYDKAAEYYETLAARYPSDAHAADALYNAGLLRQTLGQHDRAIKHYEEYARRYKERADVKDVTFQIGVVFEERKDPRNAARAFGEYAVRYPGDARTVEALVREAQAQLRVGADARAREVLAKAIASARGRDAGKEALYHAAQARYLQGEMIFREYERIKLGGKPRQLKKALDDKAKLLEQAKAIYLDAVNFKVAEWATASLYRIGQGYEAFAKAMRSAPVPADLSAEEKQVYRDELEKFVVVIEEKALDAYKSGYAKALQLGVYNKYTQAIRVALGRLSDAEFPPEHELRVGARLGEPRGAMEAIEEVRRDR
jgi:tetratricopeptide (TPR) repeat protein